MKSRKRYLFSVFIIIFLGLLSRKVDGVPLFIGDMLYALMMYYIVCFFRGNRSMPMLSGVIAVGICFFIEFSQLIMWSPLIWARGTFIGHLILGQGFLFSDLICYIVGCSVGVGIEGKYFQ